MQDFYLIVNWLVTLALLGLGFATLSRSRNQTLNKVFAVFTVSIGIWIIASYVSNDVANTPRTSVIGNYFVFLFSYVSSYLLLWFAVALAGDKKANQWLQTMTIPILLVGITTCTPLVVAGAHRQHGVYAVEFGPLVTLYFLGVVGLLISALIVLHKNIKTTNGDQQAHMVVLYRSMSIALPILLLTEFILPAATGWFGLTNVGILAMAIPVVSLYYSVVKLKMFNLRLVVIRSLAYVLAVGIISVSYSLISYYVTTIVKKANGQASQEILNVILIVVAINIYPPTIRVFRRLTNKLFYRDAYDTQELFDQLNKLLVSTLDLNKLLNQSASVVVDNLKPQFCLFDIQKTENSPDRLVGSEKGSSKGTDITSLRLVLPKIKQRVVVVDDLQPPLDEYKQTLEASNIAVLIRLSSSSSRSDSGIGYMMLGPKKSGNPYSTQDLRVLDTIANELIIAIQNALHYEEIQDFNRTLQVQIDEATRKLRRTNEKLKALDEAKDDFVSMASHQLRTPLTSIKGYTSMVLEGDAGKINATQRKLLEQSFMSSQRMVYLIADLLNVSRLKTGKFIIETAPVNVAEVVQQEIGQLKETAAGRQLTLAYDKPDAFPALMLDETKTRQVIMNLIDNAIYYTPAGGHIVVKLVETPTSVEFRVEDDGIGVPAREQPHLFTKFYRAGNARTARPDGTGLGLFMAKKVVVAQGGAILFETKEGKGSTFGFVFSKSKLAPGTSPAAA